MGALRAKTRILRRTVDQTGRIVVPAETDVWGTDPEAERYIQLITPEGPPVVVAVGPHDELARDEDDHLVDPTAIPGVDDAGAMPEDIAEGRHYQWPELTQDTPHAFRIKGDQWVSAASTEGRAKLTVIVEYLASGG